MGVRIVLVAGVGAAVGGSVGCGEIREVPFRPGDTAGSGCVGAECSETDGDTEGSETDSAGSGDSGEPIPPELLPRCNIDIMEIPDGDTESGVSGVIEVPSLGNVGHVLVAVRLMHESASDVRLVLTHDSVSVEVLDQLPCAAHNLEAVFDDDADLALEAACADDIPSVRGFVMPQAPLGPAFNGMPSAGVWTLTAFDHQTGREGTIDSWCLTVRPQ